MTNITIIGFPILTMAIVAEACLSSYKGLKLYCLKDTLANIALGITSVILGTIAKGVAFVVYSYFEQFSIFELGYQWWVYGLCFLGGELIYYFFHRLGHETQLFWASHVTHHTSLKYNFSIALRIPLQATHKFLFWVPLAVIGFDPLMIIFVDALSMIYAFFVHTETIGKLGAIEWVFNTPSHHRVHHSSNVKYLDKNFGRVLIIWDRLFRTFQEEIEKPQYGITKNVTTTNPIRLTFHEYGKTFFLLSKSTSIKQAFQYMFNCPGWEPEVKRQQLNLRTYESLTLKCSGIWKRKLI